jgi:hypothetical protein
MNLIDFPITTFLLIITTTVALLLAFTITIIRLLKQEVKKEMESHQH